MAFGHFLKPKKKNKTEKKDQNEKTIKDKIIRDIRTLFEQQQEDYYKPKRVNNLSLDEYLNSIKTSLEEYNNWSDAWKIQLTIAINFISSKDSEEEHVTHSSSDNRKFTLYSNADNVIEKLFKSLHSNDRDNLETSMKEVVLFLI